MPDSDRCPGAGVWLEGRSCMQLLRCSRSTAGSAPTRPSVPASHGTCRSLLAPLCGSRHLFASGRGLRALKRWLGRLYNRKFGVSPLAAIPSPRAFPGLTRLARFASRASRIALGLFQPLACASQFVFRQAHLLRGHVGLQPGPLHGLGRRITDRKLVALGCGRRVRTCFFHGCAREAVSRKSHTSSDGLPPRDGTGSRGRAPGGAHLSTFFVHNYVDSEPACPQSGKCAKGLHWSARSFATQPATNPTVNRVNFAPWNPRLFCPVPAGRFCCRYG